MSRQQAQTLATTIYFFLRIHPLVGLRRPILKQHGTNTKPLDHDHSEVTWRQLGTATDDITFQGTKFHTYNTLSSQYTKVKREIPVEVNKQTILTWLTDCKRDEPKCTCAVWVLSSRVDAVRGRGRKDSGPQRKRVQVRFWILSSHVGSGKVTSPYLDSISISMK